MTITLLADGVARDLCGSRLVWRVRWRRRWLGLLWVLGGILGVLIMIHFHVLLEAWTPYTIYLPVLQTLLWSYVLLVGSIGLFVVCIPHGRGLWCCRPVVMTSRVCPDLAVCVPSVARNLPLRPPGQPKSALCRSCNSPSHPATRANQHPGLFETSRACCGACVSISPD